MKILVTGGAGFIGGNFVHYMVNKYPEDMIVNLDLLTYAGITKDCVIIGVGDRLEIWSSALWDKFFEENKDSMALQADHLFENGE